MNFDLGKALTTIAPTIATMLAGPLAGTAITALESAFGLAPGAGADGITAVIQGGQMTPEILAAVRAADQRHAEVLGQQGIDLQKLNADRDAAEMAATVEDRKDARAHNAGNAAVWTLAYVVLGTFAAIMAAVLYGCYTLITGGITVKDVAVVAAISGLVGSIVGYVAANAQQVIGFIYGGSIGSEKKTEALADSVKQAIGAVQSKQP